MFTQHTHSRFLLPTDDYGTLGTLPLLLPAPLLLASRPPGFDYGVMTVGSQKGVPVKKAKDLMRDEMIAAGLAAKYFEPEEHVESRSGDRCVVARGRPRPREACLCSACH